MKSRSLTNNDQSDQSFEVTDPLKLLSELNLAMLPRHIAVIMDGNRRWAKERKLNKLEGHRAGVKTVRETVEMTLDINRLAGTNAIEILTFYAFSKENWKRPLLEVSGLMQIFEKAAIKEIEKLHERNIQINIIGNLNDLPRSLYNRIKDIVNLTKDNTGLKINFAISYSGRNEIVKGVKRIFEEYKKGNVDIETLDEHTFASYLDTGGLPDPDLLIRTSGEMRFSNFLLWQIAYTELWVTPVYWPEFRRSHYLQALKDYQKRDRRFGGR
ncbi:MAG: polyprenyl diphosphate synthase [bacterium]|nr:polyprenyl diphosphate synthase [bacterium]